MFDMFIRATVDIVTLPVSVAADAITLGGALIDRPEPYTVTKAKRLYKDAEDVVKAAAE